MMAPTYARPPTATRADALLRWTLAMLLGFLALNAVVAGALFVVAPDGRLLGMTTGGILRGPFGSYLVPGLALLALGLLSAASAVAVARRTRGAWLLAVAASAGFLVFEAVQVYVIGPFWLQGVIVALAAAAGILALVTRSRRS